MRRAFAMALVVAAFFATACGGGGTLRADVGEKAPQFSTHDLDGKSISLADYRGKTVVLNFWASWCVPCRHEFPLLAQIETRPDVDVLGVIYNDSSTNARRFVADHGGTWPALVDDGQIARAYRIGPGIPATIVIGPTGVVIKRKLGEIRAVRDLIADA